MYYIIRVFHLEAIDNTSISTFKDEDLRERERERECVRYTYVVEKNSWTVCKIKTIEIISKSTSCMLNKNDATYECILYILKFITKITMILSYHILSCFAK